MEMISPPPCPPTVTVRRNPRRAARDTPSREPLYPQSVSRNMFADKPTPRRPTKTDNVDSGPSPRPSSENLKVYLRVRPVLAVKKSRNISDSKNAWPKNPKTRSSPKLKTVKCPGICVNVNEDLRSVTVSTPEALLETKRVKSEVYEGFSHVFASEASQSDVYEVMVKPLVEDFIRGKSGMLAAMGPSGSGKTHTVFGCASNPGMVPLALRHIFRKNNSKEPPVSKIFYMSICEISSEKGKERISDLLHDGQHAFLKGLKEEAVCDAQQAESMIARGMLKRSTATTNSNTHSSRSQCIISIRYNSEEGDEEGDDKVNSSRLVIVDLAGAEREKRTGNQGVRLLESNFINNTSMVFGLCLRSLLEHQKSPNKPLPKHYQNSLLTRSMRDYLEGKKRMTLILTVKPGFEDYLDTSFLLRQASPFTRIKFHTFEEQPKLCTKRPSQALLRKQLKKMKCDEPEAEADRSFQQKDITGNKIKNGPSQNIKSVDKEHLHEIHVPLDVLPELDCEEKPMRRVECNKMNAEKDREFKILQGLSKALWSVLKEHKMKLQRADTDNCHLKESLAKEKKTSLELQNRLISNKKILSDLENELKELKSSCTCFTKASGDIFLLPQNGAGSDLSQCQTADYLEVNSESSSYSLKKMEPNKDEQCDGINIIGSAEDIKEDSAGVEADANGFKNTDSVTLHSKSKESHAGFNYVHSSTSYVDTIIEEGTSSKVESVINFVGSSADVETDVTDAHCFNGANSKALHSRFKEHSPCIGDGLTSNSFEDTSLEGSGINIVGSAADNDEGAVDAGADADVIYVTNSVSSFPSTDGAQTSNSSEDPIIEGERMASSGESVIQLRNACVYPSREYKLDILMNPKYLESENELASSPRNESTDSTQYYEAVDADADVSNDTSSLPLRPRSDDGQTSKSRDDAMIEGERTAYGGESVIPLRNACDYPSGKSELDILMNSKRMGSGSELASSETNSGEEPTKQEHCSSDDSGLRIEGISIAVNSHNTNSSSELQVDKEKFSHEKEKGNLDPLVIAPCKDGRDASSSVPNAPCNPENEKPKRRLLPASSIFLKDISIFDVKDIDDKPKGARSGKRVTLNNNNRTQGNASLLNLLTTKLEW